MEQLKVKIGQHVQITLITGKSSRSGMNSYQKKEFYWPVLLEGREVELVASEPLDKRLTPFNAGDELYIEMRQTAPDKKEWIVEHKGHREMSRPPASAPASGKAEPQQSYETIQLEKEIMRERFEKEKQDDIHIQCAIKTAVDILNHSPSVNPISREQIDDWAVWILNRIEGGLRQLQVDERKRAE